MTSSDSESDKVEFTEATPIVEALKRDRRVVEAFRTLGLKCVERPEWCVAVEVETLRHAALYHEVDLTTLLDTLNGLDLPKTETQKDGETERPKDGDSETRNHGETETPTSDG